MIRESYIWLSGLDAFAVVIAILALAFLLLSLGLISLILFKKVKRKRDEVLVQKHWDKIRQSIAFLIVKYFEEEDEQLFKRGVSVLKEIKHKSPVLAQTILNELIQQSKNLSGDSKQVLSNIYGELDFRSFSLNKLKSSKWKVAAEGIQELERMGQKSCFTKLYPFLNGSNHDLRQTARLALTSLEPRPLHFLKYVKEELSEWEQMSINIKLNKRKKEDLPDFSKYFSHPKSSVVVFSIKMSVQFNCFEYIPSLIQLLRTAKGQLLVTVINALGKLEAFQALPQLKYLVKQTNDQEVIIACLNFIGKIGDEESHVLVGKYLEHPKTDIRMAAVEAAIKLDMIPESMTEDLRSIFSHFKNELIV